MVMAGGSSDGVKLWHRQPCDDEDTWPHFQAYRDQQRPRKLTPLRCAVRGGVTPPMESLLKWYRENGWRERVAAYDAHMDEVLCDERAAVLADREKIAVAKVADMLEEGRALLANELAKMLAESEGTTFTRLKPNEIARLMDVVVKLDRLTKGQMTDNVGVDLGALSVEDLRALEALHRKAENK